mgnify:CR=1 FL=1|tara:strand:- start:202 stop:369 length:168 start_codon:yes stop_codon:yes gene_type:complete
MRVYVPDKRSKIIAEILRDLYVLRQAVDHGCGTADSKLEMIDKIRAKIQTLTEEE